MFSTKFSISCSSSYLSGTLMIRMLGCLKLSLRFLSLSSFFFFLNFVSSFCSGWMFIYFFLLLQIMDLISFPSLFVPCIFSFIFWPYSANSVSILITRVLNCVFDRLAISSSLSSIFGVLICSFSWVVFLFLSWSTCYVVRALGICQGGATHFAALWCCMWGRGQRGNNDTCSALTLLSVTSLSHRRIVPFQVLIPGGVSLCMF